MHYFKSGLISLLGFALLPVPAHAQLTPDNTLGAEASTVTPNTEVRGLPADLIQGGAIRGANLYHSFQDFNISDLQRVYFANPSGIDSILTRITGTNPSYILGTLGVDGNASLFLLNPNGILFGANAKLDVAGSFTASTADSFRLPNGSQFSATEPQAPPLLTVSITPGLQYGDTTPRADGMADRPVQPRLGADITNQGDLSVGPGQTLTLEGDTVTSSGSLTAAGGRVQLLGNQVGLFDQATIDVSSATGGGTVLIGGDFQGKGPARNARRTYVGPDALINADTTGSGNGGTVIVWADETTRFYGAITARGLSTLQPPASDLLPSNGGFVEVSGQEYLDFQGQVDTTAPFGKMGTLLLDPTNIEVVPLFGNTFDTSLAFGDAPFPTARISSVLLLTALSDIVLQATNDITINSPIGLIVPGVGFTAQAGNSIIVNRGISTLGGDIRLIANDPSSGVAMGTGGIAINNATLTTSGGDVFLQAAGDIALNAETDSAIVQTQGGLGGDGGDLTVQTPGTLRLQATSSTRQVVLSTSTFGAGDAGDLAINAGRVEVSIPANSTAGDLSGIATQSQGAGKAGSLTINTQALILQNGVNVNAVNIGSGDAGNITIVTQQLTAQNGAVINASGRGNAGEVVIQAQTIDLQDSAIGAITFSSSTGDAGKVAITTERLNLQDGGWITVQSSNNQDAGEIVIQARDIVLSGTGRDGVSRITAETVSPGVGNGGQITIDTTNLLIQNGARINTDALLSNAGDIIIRATDTVTLTNGNGDTISAIGVNGGAISLTTGQLQMQDNVAISSVGVGGNSSNITIQASRGITATNGSVILSSAVSNPSNRATSGDVQITSPTLSLQESSLISSSVVGFGTAGNVTVQSPVSVTLESDSGISILGVGDIDGGNLAITTEDLTIDGATIGTNAIGIRQTGGNLSVTTNTIALRDGSINTALGGVGSGGNLNIAADRITLTEDSNFSSGSVGSGSGGNLNIETRNLTILSRSTVTTSSGDADFLAFTFNNFLETAGASRPLLAPFFVTTLDLARNAPQGSAGALTVQASESVTIAENASLSTVGQGNSNGGPLTVKTGDLTIQDTGLLISSINGEGRAGDITLVANNLAVTSQGEISSRGLCPCGEGDAASIFITLSNDLNLNAGAITATSFQAGGGDITIQAEDVRLRQGSIISTSVFDSDGGGGDITINSNIFLALEDSDILANAEQGPGGNITIISPGFLADLFGTGQATAVGKNPGSFDRFRGNSRVDISAFFRPGTVLPPNITPVETVPGSFENLPENNRVDISADSATGESGVLNLPNVDPSRGLTELPLGLSDPSNQISQRCVPGSRLARAQAEEENRFIITGRGGIPASPLEPLSPEEVVVPWVELGETGENGPVVQDLPATLSSQPNQIVEAQRWVKRADGTVQLVADRPDAALELAQVACVDDRVKTPQMRSSLKSSELSQPAAVHSGAISSGLTPIDLK